MKQALLTLCEHLSSPLIFDQVRLAHLFRIFCVFLLCIFTFWAPCCDIRSSLPLVVCRRAHIFFTLFVFAYVQLILCCFLVMIFFILWIVHCPSVIPNVYLDNTDNKLNPFQDREFPMEKQFLFYTRGSAHWACIAHLTIEWYWSKFQRE